MKQKQTPKRGTKQRFLSKVSQGVQYFVRVFVIF